MARPARSAAPAKPAKAAKDARPAKATRTVKARRPKPAGGAGQGGRGRRSGAAAVAAAIAVIATGAGAQYVQAHGGAKAAAFQCDPGLWEHVYNPERFDGSNRTCTLAIGTVEEAKRDPTGDRDYHIRLRLDPGQDWMLLPSNGEHQDGDLVLEVICAWEGKPEHTASAEKCKGYTNHVTIPAVGDHVAAVGESVVDKAHYHTCENISPRAQHCWAELHPVTSITRIS